MLVHPLDDAWADSIDEVLRARKWPALADVTRLGALVARLSRAYNEGEGAARDLLPARLAFSFARDVPKGAGAVRELVETGLLSLGTSPLRVLDLGAGLGAMTWGVARALEAAGQQGEIEATWTDSDGAALGIASDLVRARGRREAQGVTVRARTEVRAVGAPAGPSAFDLVLLGQVLSELDSELAPDARVARHASLLTALLGAVHPHGALVVVEPALKDRTRHLHALRDALASTATIFAPCLHADACPALAGSNDWCHEDLPVDLPPFALPIARAAGLRWQGLTFSYLVLRKDGETLASRSPAWRVVSDAIVTKGKREQFVCGRAAPGATAARLRLQRLDRHASEANRPFGDLVRGDRIDIVPFTPPRILELTRVDVTRQRE